ncbi:MAG: 23S rRNA (pseudouridine(1915)-N(3))-methyltransferase RlmH, partial [Candidatus Gastranaerophilales bacterium]|nr:23S rRNA (pseudouridine(1915)-N(3))-methyltransferase RlmH [Candidatus Gastranaerophilales bacterium]
TPFCTFSVSEIQAEQINEDALSEKYKELEAERILQLLKKDSYIITLEINGKSLSSEDFAKKLKEISNEGINEISFIIGGANGLHKKVSDISNLKLSFSKMTFTHQMARLILSEQIYRAFKINANEPYHR